MLTKSDYLRYLQCRKYIWLNKKRKDLLPEVSDQQQAIFDQGYEIENYAHQLFKPGKEIAGNVFDAEKETKIIVKDGAEVIYQATAIAGKLLVKADILQYNAETKAWDIYEVKSPTEVKEEHLFDLCFQKVVFKKAGYQIGKTFLIHINKNYVRNGNIRVEELLVIEDLTSQIENLEKIVEADIPKALALTEA